MHPKSVEEITAAEITAAEITSAESLKHNLYVNLDIYTASLKQTTLIWHSLLKYHSTLRSFICHENNLRRFNFLVHSDCR